MHNLEGGYVVAWAFEANGAVGGKPEGELAVWTAQRSEWVKFDELKDLLAYLADTYELGNVRNFIEEGLEEWV